MELVSQRCESENALQEAIVTDPGGARRLREAGVIFRLGQYPRERIQFKDMRLSRLVETDVDPAPIAATEDIVGLPANPFDFIPQGGRNPRRTFEDIERVVGPVPYPLRFEGIDAVYPGGERIELDFDDGEDG